MSGLFILKGKHLLELLAVVMLPRLVGIIILLGQMLSRSNVTRLGDRRLIGNRLRFYDRLDRYNWSSLDRRFRLKRHTTHLGQLTNLALDFITDNIGGILLTQPAGNEHQTLYLIHMRQHFLYRHVHNLLYYCRLAVLRQGFALLLTCKFTNFFSINNYFPSKNLLIQKKPDSRGIRMISCT